MKSESTLGWGISWLHAKGPREQLNDTMQLSYTCVTFSYKNLEHDGSCFGTTK